MTILEINKALSESGLMFALAITGAGMTGATSFFQEAGASKFIDAIDIPYSREALQRYLHQTTTTPAVSQQVADKLATKAFTRHKTCHIGIGATGKLIVPDQREGRDNVVFFSACTPASFRFSEPHLQLEFRPTGLTRSKQEEEVAEALRSFMLKASTTM